MTAEIASFDDLLWTASRYSQVLGIDVREVNKRLATLPYRMIGARKVWHLRDALQIKAETTKKNPADMVPKDELDFYRAQREKIRLAADIGQMVMASDVERSIGEAFKTLAQTLDGLPDSLERSHGLSPAVISSIHASIDVARNVLYETLMSSLAAQANE